MDTNLSIRIPIIGLKRTSVSGLAETRTPTAEKVGGSDVEFTLISGVLGSRDSGIPRRVVTIFGMTGSEKIY